MNLNKYLQTFVLLLIFLNYGHLFRTFVPTLECAIKPSCPLDQPFLVIYLVNIFVNTACSFVPKEVLCAFLCEINEECISFNQLPNDECQMFGTLPYKIIARSGCKLFQVGQMFELWKVFIHKFIEFMQWVFLRLISFVTCYSGSPKQSRFSPKRSSFA